MANNEEKVSSDEGLLNSMKYTLREEYKVNEKDLDNINSIEGAKYLIGFFQAKNSKEDPEEKPTKKGKLRPNMGVPDPTPPDDSQYVQNQLGEDAERFFNAIKPLRLNNVLRTSCRWNKDARLLLIFDGIYPEGRVF